MKLPISPRLPAGNDLQALKTALIKTFAEVAAQVNLLSEGAIQAAYNAMTAAPTTGKYRQGDFVNNSAPTEQGAAGDKYVIKGWICIESGSPGTWVECRYLTGN